MSDTSDPQELARIQSWMRNIQDDVTRNGGVVTSRFSQAIEPMTSFIRTHKDSAGGICQTLVNHWVRFHAEDDSLWNHIYKSVGRGGQIQAIKIDEMKKLVNEFAAHLRTGFFRRKGGGLAQLKNAEKFYLAHGIIPRSTIAHGTSIEGTGSEGSGRSAGGNVGVNIYHALKKLTAYGKGAGAYVTINIYSKKGGHAIAAYVGNGAKGQELGEVLFFDPNFGEFYWGAGSTAGASHFFLRIFDEFYKDYSSFVLRTYAKKI